jgi:competence protein ComEC
MRTENFRACRKWLAIISLAVTAYIWYLALAPSPKDFRAVFLDVGQGDSILIRTPSGHTALIDGGGKSQGDDGSSIGLRLVEPVLRREGINRIDVLVLTHPHEDHIQGLLPVLKDFRIGMVLDPALPCETESYQEFLALVKSRHIPYKRAKRGQIVDFGDGVTASVLHPPTARLVGTEDDDNNNSIVLRLRFGKSALMLSGDAEMEAEADILASGARVRSDVLKVGHHGSRFSTSEQWLDASRPRVAVISVGRNNAFGHPSRETLGRLSVRRIRILRTDENGPITVRFSSESSSNLVAIPSTGD